jgi:tetratricopeptide (TPR) repeat protein
MRIKTAILLLIFIGVLTYSNLVLNGFVGDDYLQIIDNTSVHSLGGIGNFFTGSTYESGGADKIAGIFYRPLMMSFFSIIYFLSGPDPIFFHLFQAFLHIVNSILVFIFMKRFFRNISSFFAAVVFLAHPINNEAVVYIANLQEVLFFLFGMSALLIIKKEKIISRKKTFLVSLLLFLSLLAKESGVLFLPLISMYCFLYSKKNFRNITLANSIVFVFYLFLRYGVAKMHQAQESIAQISNASLWERVLHIPAIITYYLKIFFFPVWLGGDQFWFIKNPGWENFYLPLIICVVFFVFLAVGLFYFKKNIKLFPDYLFFVFWLLSGLSLHLQVIKLDATVADRWFYFPIAGLLGVLARYIEKLKIWPKSYRKIGLMALVLIVAALMTRTFLRNFDWRNELTLFAHDIRVTEKNFVLDNLYASALIQNGEFRRAKPYVQSSINEYPFYANLNNMAIVYTSEKNYMEAKKYLKRAVDMSSYYVVYENYANFLYVYDDLAEAEEFTEHALKIFPENSKLWLILAKIKYFKGDNKSAIYSAQKASNISQSEYNLRIIKEIKEKRLDDSRKVTILNTN